MTPEDFDIEFDFDKEYGFTGGSGKNGQDPDDFDLDAALARELGPDFDALFEKEYEEAQAALKAEAEAAALVKEAPGADLEPTMLFRDFRQLEEEDDEDDAAPEADDDTMDDIDAIFAASSASIAAATADVVKVSAPRPLEVPMEDAPPVDEPVPVMRRPERRPRPKGVDIGAMVKKVDMKAVGEKFSGAGQVIAENSKSFVDALSECKPGQKMNKKQLRRFKDDVLPFLIGGAAALLCLIFIIGSLGRVFDPAERQEAALQESIAQAEAEAAAAAEIQRILGSAAVHASGYDFQSAIDVLDSYKDPETGRELTEEMLTRRAEYAAALADVVVWDDPAAITNLSFHVLIEDTVRAYADASYAGSYRKNFISTAQFSAILEDLYDKGYVLVNLDSCIASSTDASGKTTYTVKPIYLPSGKTPIMITETLVNYFGYMIDSDKDGLADAGGDGFASRLVIEGGKVKAEYVDAAGQTHVGDYDLVPILDTFIDTHPDFSYRGARAILAVTGEEGIFGWRTNEDESLVDGVKDVVEVLRANGYQIACNSFANLDYGASSLADISADLGKWKNNIAPILGDVDIAVIARGGSIAAPESIEGAGSRFSAVYDAGFRYIIDADDAPGGRLTADFFYQNRVMVTGSSLTSGAFSSYFNIPSQG